ncbi:MAG: hypothetical protein ACHQHN_19105 [Sphingobacteriales bacterium]
MKKIYYILILGALGLTACQKEPQLQTSTHTAPSSVQALNITLQNADYGKLSSGYPKTSFSFDDLADANTYIPQILNAEYLTSANGSSAAVTYTVSSLYFKPAADSLYNDVYYSLTDADYLLLPGNKYTDFSISQATQWLPYQYTTPKSNQLALLNFTVYPATQNPPPPYSFLYFNGAWRYIYTIQPAQYTQAGVGKFNQFTTSNSEALLASSFNFFLKNDITIMDTVKKNDYIFVSFDYFVSSTKTAYQRVKPLQFDGNNFVPPYQTTATATFVKANGTWKSQPIVTYTLTTADITLVGNGAAGSATAKANLVQFKDFDSSWPTADMDAAVIECLLVDFPTPQTGTIYKVTFPNYNSPAPNPLSFTWDGSKWTALQ